MALSLMAYPLMDTTFGSRNEFKIFTNVHSAVVDPKNFNPNHLLILQGDICVIPPNSFVWPKR